MTTWRVPRRESSIGNYFQSSGYYRCCDFSGYFVPKWFLWKSNVLFCWKSRLLECGISTAVALCCQCSRTIGKIFSPTELWTRYQQRRHNQFYVDVEEHAGGLSNSVPLVLATVSLSSETILHAGGIFSTSFRLYHFGERPFLFFFFFSFFFLSFSTLHKSNVSKVVFFWQRLYLLFLYRVHVHFSQTLLTCHSMSAVTIRIFGSWQKWLGRVIGLYIIYIMHMWYVLGRCNLNWVSQKWFNLVGL